MLIAGACAVRSTATLRVEAVALFSGLVLRGRRFNRVADFITGTCGDRAGTFTLNSIVWWWRWPLR